MRETSEPAVAKIQPEPNGKLGAGALMSSQTVCDFGTQTRNELRQILESLVIESPAAFTLGGRRIQVDGSVRLHLPYTPTVQNPLVAALQAQFYQYCYSRRFAGALTAPPPSNFDNKDLVAELAASNLSRERWESGWQIIQVLASGQLAVQRNGLSRLLFPGEYLSTDGAAGMPSRGSFVSVYCKKHSTALQPGFYFAFGETLPDQQDETSPVRFYWNIEAAGITELVGTITKSLNRFQIPFRFKCLTNGALYERADAAVLFVAKRLYRIVAELLQDVHETVAPRLRPETPLFSKPLADGLGLAEDPGNGESFGSNRCRLLAEGIYNAEALGARTVEARAEEIEKHFKRSGLLLESLYLGPGSLDIYDWPPGSNSHS